ncbi:WSC domain protein, putative [Aspergillus lentulus]|uniref:WSC domain protein, putative n=1 Tax=Aspergillus lentulus TaxID=293939 RepID=A0ABQ1A9K2_ASPLE|nr:WSC domain protein, putative [Aspergillus lentulus]GFF39700.1 WSC domain protein, putative [Aspergillus lentulus]GFF57842.1 WSC domain protein, putative [Aspergillus lentulus]GFF76823.1 WSC domain protein, putative [Aspergillus lentulus]GFF80308.1 WSC domain protein, putative [Aspergillus lentulus]
MKPFTVRSAFTASALLLTTNLPAVFAADMVSEGCFSDSAPLVDQGPYTYQSNGYCQQLCLKTNNNLVFALTKGSNCLCGNELPAKSAKTADSNCNVKCAGWPDVMCGGANTFSVYLTGLSSNVPYYQDDDSSASTNSSSTSTTNGGSTVTTGSQGQVVTQGEQTVVVTAAAGNGVGATNGLNEEKNKDGPNTAAIAAGVVVGVVGFCSLVGAGFFLWRFRKRTNVRPQYSNNAGATEHFGKPMSQDSMSDSRFDGDFMAQRRQSNGSIDDDQDFSRRILQVTNPDHRR